MKIDKQTIFEIHRLDDLGWSERKIARHLRVSRPSVNKYLTNPYLSPVKRAPRPSKLDAYRDLIKEFVEDDHRSKHRWSYNGFKIKALTARSPSLEITCKNSEAAIESDVRLSDILNSHRAGKCRSTGGTLSIPYGETTRKLYAFAAIECYSRMAYVEFTHSQNQHSLHQGLLNAFTYWGGSTQEMVVDNMITAVIERQGSLIRFNGAFLDFCESFT